jgi:hypothetical protein
MRSLPRQHHQNECRGQQCHCRLYALIPNTLSCLSRHWRQPWLTKFSVDLGPLLCTLLATDLDQSTQCVACLNGYGQSVTPPPNPFPNTLGDWSIVLV